MSKIQAVSRELHTNKSWRRPDGYRFTTRDSICPLMAQELPKAILSLPVAFISSEDCYKLVAVQGLRSGQNLLVADNGQWLAGYTPAVYRGYPFVLASNGEGQGVLCVDEDSELVIDVPNAEKFFEKDGTPAKAVTEIMEFLTQLHSNRETTDRICTLLNRNKLIQAWPINIRRDAGEESITGLYRINESALNSLSAEALEELRDGGALLAAYCQLISMQNLAYLAQLLQKKERVAASSIPKELDLDFLNDSGNISF